MTKNKLINYDELVDSALRSVVKIVLNTLEKNEPIGDHHFFITFQTKHKNVKIPNSFMENHPKTMTIVLQHQYWDLEVGENKFSVKLSFNGKQEKLSIGYDAITQFTDPSTDFSLQFTLQNEIVNDENFSENQSDEKLSINIKGTKDENKNKVSDNSIEPDDKKIGEIISFDQFKKKK